MGDGPDDPRVWISSRDLADLQESEQRFRALSEATFEAVIVHDGGKILFANAAAHEVYGVSDLRGRSMFDFVAPESLELVRRKSSAGEVGRYEAVGRRANGETFAAEARARAIQFQGRTVRIVAIRDDSVRKALEASLAAQDRLATMGRLAAGVAHEVNNPLTFAMLNLEGVTRALSSWPRERERVLEMLAQVRTGLERVSRVVQDMRAFSRVEPHGTRPVELGRVLEYATSVVGVEVRARAALRIDVGEAMYVRGDEARLGQVFVNLLVNAAHAIPEGEPSAHRVVVTARRDGDTVEIAISDTGSGIPESVRAHLFEPFHTTKAPGIGTGLGLSICHAIVTSLGGTISADAPAEHGTTFRVRLPAADDADADATDATTTRPTRASRHRVLVVDDETMLRQVIAQMLGSDYEVSVAGSVAEALAILEGDVRFDAILCDIVMPRQTGLDFHTALSDQFPQLVGRLGFITGGVLDGRIHDFLERSGRPRVYKPFSLSELHETVRALVGD
jgi:PAS domain S-box-containing protein